MNIALIFLTLSLAGEPSVAGEFEAKVNATLSELRTLATALEAYAVDHGRYPDPDELKEALDRRYLHAMTDGWGKDGWGSEIRYLVAPRGDRYRLVSPGSDAEFEAESLAFAAEPPLQSACSFSGVDLIYEAYRFRRVPSGFETAFQLKDENRAKLQPPSD